MEVRQVQARRCGTEIHGAVACARCRGALPVGCGVVDDPLLTAPSPQIIVLKRFYHTGRDYDKIGTLVRFPLRGLDLTRWVEGPVRGTVAGLPPSIHD